MKIRFGKNDVIDTKAVNGAVEVSTEAYVPSMDNGSEYLDMFVDACDQVSESGTVPISVSVDENGALIVKSAD